MNRDIEHMEPIRHSISKHGSAPKDKQVQSSASSAVVDQGQVQISLIDGDDVNSLASEGVSILSEDTGSPPFDFDVEDCGNPQLMLARVCQTRPTRTQTTK